MPNSKVQLSQQTLLVIDDVEMNQSVIRKIFGDQYNVLVADNGLKGLELMQQAEVDLVLLDIVMPLMDGFEVLKAMKANPLTSKIPVVIITGEVNRAEKQALELGADDFIEKPYDPYIIRKRVDNLIEKYHLQKLHYTLQEQKRFRQLFDILDLGYWEWSKENGYYHSERYTQYAISEMADEDMWDPENIFRYVHPEDVNSARDFMHSGLKDKIKKSAVVRFKMKDGSYRWTEMIAVIDTEDNGQLVRFVSIVRDVDKELQEQKKQLQDALKKAEDANAAKTAFLSRISHDMRTPLNGILGLTTLLKERTRDSKVLNDLSDLEMSGNYLLNLINDTLDMSRIESGKLDLNPTVCDGRNLFNNALTLAKTNADSKHIRLEVNADNIPFTLLYADAGRIEQVAMNVVGNAIKFTPEGGTIEIALENISLEEGILTDRLVIKDSGVGMSKEFLPHIFEPFSQEDTTRTTSYQGTGLGMAITKQLVERMGGEIFVESELGVGTTFTILFKFHVASEEQIETWKNNLVGTGVGVDLQGKRALLCEDHPLNATIATRILARKGMIVERAENGQIGVEMFAHSVLNYYDVILMDIRMPVLDGLEATKEIRKMSRRDARVIPIIAMTANAFEDDIRETKEAGMDAHLSKPIQTEILYRTLGDLLKVDKNIRKKQILIVDDVEVNRVIIKMSLENDYEILEAENGKQAMDILRKTRGIDVVITDIQMPEMDGIELIRNIRETDDFKHIVIIANTQFGDPEQEEQLLALGANDFVYKPTTPRIVEIRVRNALQRL